MIRGRKGSSGPKSRGGAKTALGDLQGTGEALGEKRVRENTDRGKGNHLKKGNKGAEASKRTQLQENILRLLDREKTDGTRDAVLY